MSLSDLSDDIERTAAKNFRWLASCQVTEVGPFVGGILDPLERRTEGEHYAASHVAWAGANLRALSREESCLPVVEAAGEYAVRFLHDYPDAHWGRHNDFNNYALAQAVSRLSPHPAASRWRVALREAVASPYLTANWCAMRAAFEFWRADEFGSSSNRVRGHAWLVTVLARQQPSGAFEDHFRTSVSAQYHAFTCAVLAKLPAVSENRFLARRVARAVKFCQALVYGGDLLHYGRGHRQIFGYAAALYVLAFGRMAFGMDTEPELRAVWRLLRESQREDGSFPLCLAPFDDEARVGWYDYNRLSVYNAFACAWLSETALLLRSPVNTLPAVGSSRKRQRRLRRSGPFIVPRSQDSCAVLLGARSGRYGSDCGFAPHLLALPGQPPIVGFPGGPERGSFGDLFTFPAADVNFFAPAVRRSGRWHSVARNATETTVTDSGYASRASCRELAATRRWEVGATVVVKDEIQARVTLGLHEFAPIVLPLLCSSDAITMEDGRINVERNDGAVSIVIQSSVPLSLRVASQCNWVTGPLTIVMGYSQRPVTRGDRLSLRIELSAG